MTGDAQPGTDASSGAEPATGGPRRSAWFWGGTAVSPAPYLLAVTVLGRAAQNMGQTTYPLIAHQLLDVGNGVLGAIPAAAGLLSVVTSATLAARTTRSSALPMLAAGQALVVAAFALLALSTGVAGLWSAALLLGVGGGLVFPATMTMMGWAPAERRARALAVFALALSIGLVFGPLIESEVLHLLDGSLRATFALMLPMPVLATVVAATAQWRRPTPEPDAGAPRAGADPTSGAAKAGAAGKDPTVAAGGTPASSAEPTAVGTPLVSDVATEMGVAPGPRPPAWGAALSTASRRWTRVGAGRGDRQRLPALLHYPAYRLAVTVMLTYQAPFAALVTFGALLARRADGTSAAGASLAFAVFFAVSLGLRSMVVASPVRHRRIALVFAVVTTAVGLAALGSSRGVAPLVVGMAVLGAPHGLTLPLASGLLAEGVPAHVLGRANARLMATTNLVTIVVPFACGWLVSAIGYRSMFLTLELPVVVFGTVLLCALRAANRPVPDGSRRHDRRAAVADAGPTVQR